SAGVAPTAAIALTASSLVRKFMLSLPVVPGIALPVAWEDQPARCLAGITDRLIPRLPRKGKPVFAPLRQMPPFEARLVDLGLAFPRTCRLAEHDAEEPMHRPLSPGAIPPPFSAYSNGVEVPAGQKLVFCSGQLGIAADGMIPPTASAQA